MKFVTWPSVLAFALTVFAFSSSHVQAGGILFITHGDTISNMGALPQAEHDKDGNSYDKLGYKYSYLGLFWLDLFTWGGEWCVYDGDHYVSLTQDEAAEEVNKQPSELTTPFNYRHPLGRWVVAALLVLFGVSAYAQKKSNQPTVSDVTPKPLPSAANPPPGFPAGPVVAQGFAAGPVAVDPSASTTAATGPVPPPMPGAAPSVSPIDARAAEIYRQTLGNGEITQARADAAFEAGVAHLVANGVSRESAIDRLLTQIQSGAAV